MKDSDKQHEEAVKSYEAFMKRHPTPYIACLHSKLQRARREIGFNKNYIESMKIFDEINKFRELNDLPTISPQKPPFY